MFKYLLLSFNKVFEKISYFLKSADTPAISKNIALSTLIYSEPTITNIVAIMNPTPATSEFLLT